VTEAAATGELPVRPLAPRIGCEVLAGKDELLSGKHAAGIRQLLVTHGVLCFRGAWLSDEEQVRFAQTLGRVATDWDVSADKRVNNNQTLAEYRRS
jgi:alpha-ketoglutarate-dependent taurine dioxygenase